MFAGDWGLEVRGHGGGSHVPVDLCDSVRGGHLGFIPSAGLPESYYSEWAAHLRNTSHMMSNEDNGLALVKQICWRSVRMFIVVSRFKPLVDSKSFRVCLKPCYCIERAKKKKPHRMHSTPPPRYFTLTRKGIFQPLFANMRALTVISIIIPTEKATEKNWMYISFHWRLRKMQDCDMRNICLLSDAIWRRASVQFTGILPSHLTVMCE